MTKRITLAGEWFLLGGALMISFSPVMVRLTHVPPTVSGFYRMLFGGLLLLIMAWMQGERFRPGRTSLDRAAVGWAALCGLFFAMDLFVWHRSVFRVGPGLSTILANFQVFFMAAVGSLFMGERLGPRLLIAAPLALVGLGLLVGLHHGLPGADYQIGVVQGLGAALAYTAYLLSLRRMQSGDSPPAPITTVALLSLFCAAFLGISALLEGDSFYIPDTQTWLALLAYGLVVQVLGWVLISKGLPRTAASRAGLILLSQPTLSFTWDILFFDRPTDFWGGLGAVMAIGAIYLGSMRTGSPAISTPTKAQ